MHPDAQPDRGQRRPLQRQRARHRVATRGERGHEAVTLALFERAHPVMGGDASFTVRFSSASAAVICSGWVSHSRVEPSTSASSNVTVPVGSNSLTPNSLQVSGGISACWLIVASIADTLADYIREIAQITRPRARTRLGSQPRVLDELDAGGQAELGVNVGEMGLDGAW